MTKFAVWHAPEAVGLSYIGLKISRSRWIDENNVLEHPGSRWIEENGVLEHPRFQWIGENNILEHPRSRWIDENTVLERPKGRWIDENSILEVPCQAITLSDGHSNWRSPAPYSCSKYNIPYTGTDIGYRVLKSSGSGIIESRPSTRLEAQGLGGL